MKIVLVYHEYPDTFWIFKHVLRFIAKKAAFSHLGVLKNVAVLIPESWVKSLSISM